MLVSAVIEFGDFSTASATQLRFGLHPGWVWAGATILTQMIGSLLMIAGRSVWLGAGVLAAFTCATQIIAHPLWELTGPTEFAARNRFFEHFALVAGLVMVALLAKEPNRTSARAGGAALGARSLGELHVSQQENQPAQCDRTPGEKREKREW